jgi:hypothetical protein
MLNLQAAEVHRLCDIVEAAEMMIYAGRGSRFREPGGSFRDTIGFDCEAHIKAKCSIQIQSYQYFSDLLHH